MRHSPNAGGYDFPRDPDIPSNLEPLFWLPDLNPGVIRLCATNKSADFASPLELTGLRNLDLRRASDGWHGIWNEGRLTHQFWLEELPSETAALYAAILPLDGLFELRTQAARRLWRSLSGRKPGPSPRALPAQFRRFHTLSVRALDARQHGASYRTIADVLIGFRGTKEDFEIDPRKNQARRLVANSQRMMKGGYKALLHYPVKLRLQMT